MKRRDQAGITEFAARIYEATRRIPRGSVTTYKYLAWAVGCHSCRAVGQALRRNPFAPSTPCHRVIASDLTIGGFKGSNDVSAIAEKRARLEREGVTFVNGKLRDPSRICRL